MKNLISKLKNYFGYDSLLHIIASSIIMGVSNLFLPVWMAIAITAAIGIGKEIIYDKLLDKGTCDFKDIVADAIGIGIGIL